MTCSYDNRPYLRHHGTISAYDNAGGQGVTDTAATLNLDTERLNTDDGSFVLASDVVTINSGGKYMFTYRATVDNAGKNEIEAWLERDQGSGYSEVDGTKIKLIGSAAVPPGITTITADTTLTTSHRVVLCNAASAAIAVTLPAAADNTDREYIIKKIDSSANAITIDANALEEIDGGLTAVLLSQYEAITVESDGSNWWIS